MLCPMHELNEGKLSHVLMRSAGGILALLWIVSMSVVDGNACTAAPACLTLGVVAALAVGAMAAGFSPARPSLTLLLGLAVGAFFVLRCALSESKVEAWSEMGLLLGGFAFYIAGFAFAQRRAALGWLLTVLGAAVLVNILFFFLLRDGQMPLEWTGRPTWSLGGVNTRNTTLFVYKNFAGIFLMLAGALLLWCTLWGGWRQRGAVIAALVGIAAMVCACGCGTRAVLLLLPLLVLGGCVLGIILRLYSGRALGWVWPLASGLCALGLLVMLVEFLLDGEIVGSLLDIETHLRSAIWFDVIGVAADAPWCGYGARSAQWMIVPFYDGWQTPNFAHNEYIQAWCDYGVLGMLLMLAVIVVHLSAGFWKLAVEGLPEERRRLVALAMMQLVLMAACAVVDYVWHSFALVAMTAFACGVLASPVPRDDRGLLRRRNWAAGSRPRLLPVPLLRKSGRLLAAAAVLALGGACLWLGLRLLPAWKVQWQFNTACHREAPVSERRALLMGILREYPDSALVDNYVLQTGEGAFWDWVELESALRLALEANPRQLFSVVMLADVLGRQGRCEEVEALLRDHYPRGGMKGTRLTNWPSYYAMNLLRWGKLKLGQGEHGAALSMMSYAFNMNSHGYSLFQNTRYRAGYKPWVEPWWNKKLRSFVDACRTDVRAMRAIGIEPDESWQQPLRAGGPPALYARWSRPKAK